MEILVEISVIYSKRINFDSINIFISFYEIFHRGYWRFTDALYIRKSQNIYTFNYQLIFNISASLLRGLYPNILASLLRGLYPNILASLLRGLYPNILASLLCGLYPNILASLLRGLYPNILASLLRGLYSNILASLLRGLYPNILASLLHGLYKNILASLLHGLHPNAQNQKHGCLSSFRIMKHFFFFKTIFVTAGSYCI